MIFLALLGPSLVAALLALVARPHAAVSRWVHAILAGIPMAAAAGIAMRVLAGDTLVSGPWQILRADALSALLASCVAVVAALASWAGPGASPTDGYDDKQVRQYRVFSSLFAFTMLLAVSSNNVGLMWVSIEATTIASAVLVPLRVSRSSVEASWKYLLIGSVGIVLAFVGTVLAYFDFVTLTGASESALNWSRLVAVAPMLHRDVIRMAFVFLLVGYGTKAGLAPMHTWLPDAHSEAPAPLSAMMSGVLLAVALYAIARWKVVVDRALHTGYTDTLLIVVAVASLVIAAFSLVSQASFKRMLAYSSIEHTGLTCLGLALGPAGTLAALLHMANHSLAKSVMFLLAGRIQHRFHTADVQGVSGLLRTMPITGGLFAMGLLALLGLPPFGLFISELLLFRAGFLAGHRWLMGFVLALLTMAFVSMIAHLNRMLYGVPPAAIPAGERWSATPILVAVCLVVLVVFCLALPGPVRELLDGGVAVIAP